MISYSSTSSSAAVVSPTSNNMLEGTSPQLYNQMGTRHTHSGASASEATAKTMPCSLVGWGVSSSRRLSPVSMYTSTWRWGDVAQPCCLKLLSTFFSVQVVYSHFKTQRTTRCSSHLSKSPPDTFGVLSDCGGTVELIPSTCRHDRGVALCRDSTRPTWLRSAVADFPAGALRTPEGTANPAAPCASKSMAAANIPVECML